MTINGIVFGSIWFSTFIKLLSKYSHQLRTEFHVFQIIFNSKKIWMDSTNLHNDVYMFFKSLSELSGFRWLWELNFKILMDLWHYTLIPLEISFGFPSGSQYFVLYYGLKLFQKVKLKTHTHIYTYINKFIHIPFQ